MQDDKNNLVSQWEKMGSSTGGMLGRFIGLAAETGLRTIDQIILTPLANTRDEVNKSAVQNGVKQEETRSNVWTEMGRQYGEKMGSAMGIAMDSAIEATNVSVIRPMERNTNSMEVTEAEHQENNNEQQSEHQENDQQ